MRRLSNEAIISRLGIDFEYFKQCLETLRAIGHVSSQARYIEASSVHLGGTINGSLTDPLTPARPTFSPSATAPRSPTRGLPLLGRHPRARLRHDLNEEGRDRLANARADAPLCFTGRQLKRGGQARCVETTGCRAEQAGWGIPQIPPALPLKRLAAGKAQ
jgi:hypothetical protein